MAQAATTQLPAMLPLTALSDEERMFQAAAREFAEKEVGPHVEEMDREGVFKRELIDKFFAQGFMGLEVPKTYGGSGGTFFIAVLAIEEFCRVDGSAAVAIDVKIMLASTALMRERSEAQEL